MYLGEREKRDEERGREGEIKKGREVRGREEAEGRERERGREEEEEGVVVARRISGTLRFPLLSSRTRMERRGWDSWPFFLGSVLVRGRTR